jgi:hypothetical protein
MEKVKPKSIGWANLDERSRHSNAADATMERALIPASAAISAGAHRAVATSCPHICLSPNRNIKIDLQ